MPKVMASLACGGSDRQVGGQDRQLISGWPACLEVTHEPKDPAPTAFLPFPFSPSTTFARARWSIPIKSRSHRNSMRAACVHPNFCFPRTHPSSVFSMSSGSVPALCPNTTLPPGATLMALLMAPFEDALKCMALISSHLCNDTLKVRCTDLTPADAARPTDS